MALRLIEEYTVSQGDVRRHTISFAGVLLAGEKLTGVPTITYSGADLIFSGIGLNAAPVKLESKGLCVPANEAAQLTTQGQLAANTPYTFVVTVQTTQGQTIACEVRMHVI